jgi:hypothetical protein
MLSRALFPLAVVSIVLFACGGAAAQSLVFEQPAPTYVYDAVKPAYLHFKEVTVTRNSKYSLDFDFTLQAPLPSRFPKGEGVRYKVYFDFDGTKSEFNEKKIAPDFVSDLIISVFQNPNTSRFESWVSLVRVENTVHEIKVTKLKAKDDKISFSARCELFGKLTGLRFAVSTGLLDAKSGKGTQDLGGQDSKVFAVPFKADGLLVPAPEESKPGS